LTLSGGCSLTVSRSSSAANRRRRRSWAADETSPARARRRNRRDERCRSPQDPHASSTVTFSFTAPNRAGIVGKVIDSFSLSVTGPAGANCKGSDERAGTPAAKGATEHIALGPTQLGANWCVGPYTARVFEIQRPYCKPGLLCAQYVRVAGIVAETSFSITR
jgi:hypothetical protein